MGARRLPRAVFDLTFRDDIITATDLPTHPGLIQDLDIAIP